MLHLRELRVFPSSLSFQTKFELDELFDSYRSIVDVKPVRDSFGPFSFSPPFFKLVLVLVAAHLPTCESRILALVRAKS